MLKYAGPLLVVIALAFYIARQDERAAEQRAQASQSSKANEQQTQEKVVDRETGAPSWYGIFRWPNGTGTWAIILTLMAIAEQTKETRKSAQAAKEAASSALLNAKAMVNAERAWILVRKGKTGDIGIAWRIENFGRSPAKIVAISWSTYNAEPNAAFPAGEVVQSAQLAAFPSILAPHEDWKFAEFEPLRDFAAIWSDVTGARRTFYFTCHIRYCDVLMPDQIRETETAMVYNSVGGFSPVDSDKYNRNT